MAGQILPYKPCTHAQNILNNLEFSKIRGKHLM